MSDTPVNTITTVNNFIEFMNYRKECFFCDKKLNTVYLFNNEEREVDEISDGFSIKMFNPKNEFIIRNDNYCVCIIDGKEENEEYIDLIDGGILLRYCENCESYRYYSSTVNFYNYTNSVSPVKIYSESFDFKDKDNSNILYAIINYHIVNISVLEVNYLNNDLNDDKFNLIDVVNEIELPLDSTLKMLNSNIKNPNKIMSKIKKIVALM